MTVDDIGGGGGLLIKYANGDVICEQLLKKYNFIVT